MSGLETKPNQKVVWDNLIEPMTIRQLQKKCRMSKHTVQRALYYLRRSGLVFSAPGNSPTKLHWRVKGVSQFGTKV